MNGAVLRLYAAGAGAGDAKIYDRYANELPDYRAY